MKTIEWERVIISSKKIRDTKGTFYAKMGTIKDKWYGPNRSRRYQEEVKEYTEKLYKKRWQ